jgi:NADH-quinone oxidoreductase subunit M
VLLGLLIIPLLAMLLVLVLPQSAAGRSYRWLALGAGLLQLAWLVLVLWPDYAAARAAVPDTGSFPASDRYWLLSQADWLRIPLGSWGTLRVQWLLGMDGVGLMLTALTVGIFPIVVLASWDQSHRSQAYFALLLLLQVALVGTFLALDAFLFYVFFEFMLLPMYFLIGVWGGPARHYAATKFFLYTLAGSLLLLVGFLALAFSYGQISGGNVEYTFDLRVWQMPEHLLAGQLLTDDGVRTWVFWAIVLAFLVKLPSVPLHTWLPDAHVQASTPISVILAAVLLKVGGYGLYRFAWGLFPDVALDWQLWLAVLGLVSLLYGALCALAQTNLKRMIAYSSVSHMGFVVLGLASMRPEGVHGAMLQLLTHGITSAGLFLLAGVLYWRVGSLEIRYFQGLWQRMPHYTFLVFLLFFAALGLPGLCAFVAEVLVMAGLFRAAFIGTLPLWVPLAALLSLILTAAYFLMVLRRMFFGPFAVKGGAEWEAVLTDLTLRERLTLWPLAALAVLLGVMPSLALGMFQADTAAWLDSMRLFLK